MYTCLIFLRWVRKVKKMFCWAAAKKYNLGHLWQKKMKWFPFVDFAASVAQIFYSGKSTILGEIINKFMKENLYFLQILDFLENDGNLCNACSKIYKRESLHFFVSDGPSYIIWPPLNKTLLTWKTKKFFWCRKKNHVFCQKIKGFPTHLKKMRDVGLRGVHC